MKGIDSTTIQYGIYIYLYRVVQIHTNKAKMFFLITSFSQQNTRFKAFTTIKHCIKKKTKLML